jgi:cobyrinic acid a,c-diamide synthase
MNARAIVVAGAASGVGKTSITLGLLEAWRRRGLRVQAFKVGPDFIDPGLHAAVTGRPSFNLDGWMCGRDRVLACVSRAAADADVVVVEGVMGCFDGVDGTRDDGSTAQVAKWLQAPVLLVVDAAAASRSVAAVALGFERFDPELRVAAVVANRVAGATHARWVTEAIAASCRAVPLGAVAHDAGVVRAERHLGLVTAVEAPLGAEYRRRLADLVERSIDLDRLLALAEPVALPAPPPAETATARATIGVARDAAFQFYYAENLALLREAGARLVFWSPLADPAPPDADGLYFGGGYPELHAQSLADNGSMLKAVLAFAESGRPIYAECGGLMLLAESLEDMHGVPHAMVGLLPARVRMARDRLTLGYRQVELAMDGPLGAAGLVARGQEFHCSTLGAVPDRVRRIYRVTSPTGTTDAEGYMVGRAVMSYIHLHFASNPALPRAFVDACLEARR